MESMIRDQSLLAAGLLRVIFKRKIFFGIFVFILHSSFSHVLACGVFIRNPIGCTVKAITDPTLGTATRSVVDPFKNAIQDIIGQTRLLLNDTLESTDEIAKARLEQLDDIILRTNILINEDLDRIDDILGNALSELEMLRAQLFRDIDGVFEQIYGVIDEAQCTIQGSRLEAQLLTDYLIENVSDRITLHSILSDLVGLRQRSRFVANPTTFYERVKSDLLRTLDRANQNMLVEDILDTYFNLMYHARTMVCLSGSLVGSEAARERYKREFIGFERSFDIWWTIYRE
jgi:hypothetical protein